MNVAVPIIGPTYQSSSLPVANQVTRNFLIEADQNSDTVAALVPFPGLKLFAATPKMFSRGLGRFNGELYSISEDILYRINAVGDYFEIGFIGGSNRCSIEESTTSLVIATGEGKPYAYDGTILTQGTDIDLPEASTVSYIRNRVAYDGVNGDIAFADLGSPLSVNSANVTSVDTNPDATLAVQAFRDQLFVFSEHSITPYYNSGTVNPPFLVIPNAFTGVGVAAIHSIAVNSRSMFFLGSDLMVYRVNGLQPEPVGNSSIGAAISKYPSGSISGAYGVCFNLRNQYLYLLTFPGQASWLYTDGIGWTNLAYGVEGEPHLIADYQYCYGRHLVSDRLSGNIYELDFDTFTDNGNVIERRRDTKKITGKDLGRPGKEIYMSRLEVVLETGAGTISGQGENPKLMMSYSDDGGRTWSPEQWADIGSMGSFTYSQNPIFYDLGSFYERQFQFRVTDPVKAVLISANADIEVGP